MSTAPVLVVGATGNVGRHVVKHLVSSGHRVRALTRDPKTAAALLGTEVEIVKGDLDDPASLASALEGVAVASLATASTPDLGRQEVNFIDAASVAGVRRLVKQSGVGVGVLKGTISVAHGESERRLHASGVPSVLVKPVTFMSNLLLNAEAIKGGSLPSLLGDARLSLVDPRDVGELTAHVLVDPHYDGQTLRFGGPAALTHDEIAAALSEVLGRPISHVRLEVPAFRESAARRGLPVYVIETVVEAATFAPNGTFVASDDVIRRALGRPASPLSNWVERNREALAA
jgi:uncharacterized protein YbjT (DUF2867 family)